MNFADRLRRGDPGAWRRATRIASSVAARCTSSSHEAEDVTQEALVEFRSDLNTTWPAGAPEEHATAAYLGLRVKWVARTRSRREAKHREIERTSLKPHAMLLGELATSSLETIQAVTTLLQQPTCQEVLNSAEGGVFLAWAVEGATLAEIALQRGISVATAYRMKESARCRLAACLKALS